MWDSRDSRMRTVNPVDWIKGLVLNSLKVTDEVKRHLKPAGGYCSQSIVNITTNSQ